MSENPELIQAVEETAPTHSPKQEVKREVLELVKMVLLFLILFWGLKTFVVEGYEVQGQSMLPTLEDRERILVFKLPFQLSKLPLLGGLTPIGEQDIIVFESDPEIENDRSAANKRFIKRVVAKGPDRQRGNIVDAQHRDAQSHTAVKVVYDRGRVYVNNQRLEEHYLDPRERTASDERPAIYLDAGQYYVLGDHRGVSKDSRVFGAVDESQIIGRAVFRFWPLSKFGPL